VVHRYVYVTSITVLKRGFHRCKFKYTHTNKHIDIHTHTYWRTHTHLHTHTHTQTHAHTHSLSLSLFTFHSCWIIVFMTSLEMSTKLNSCFQLIHRCQITASFLPRVNSVYVSQTHRPPDLRTCVSSSYALSTGNKRTPTHSSSLRSTGVPPASLVPSSLTSWCWTSMTIAHCSVTARTKCRS